MFRVCALNSIALFSLYPLPCKHTLQHTMHIHIHLPSIYSTHEHRAHTPYPKCIHFIHYTHTRYRLPERTHLVSLVMRQTLTDYLVCAHPLALPSVRHYGHPREEENEHVLNAYHMPDPMSKGVHGHRNIHEFVHKCVHIHTYTHSS